MRKDARVQIAWGHWDERIAGRTGVVVREVDDEMVEIEIVERVFVHRSDVEETWS